MPDVYIISYIEASFFLHQMEAITVCLLSFSTRKKNVYEQTTVHGLSAFSDKILRTKETFSFYNWAFHLKSNLKHS